jgi:PEP-CTERM motif
VNSKAKVLVAVLLLIPTGQMAAASTYSFSFSGAGVTVPDPIDPNAPTELVAGTVTGLIFGLDAGVNGEQAPTSAEVLSAPFSIIDQPMVHFEGTFGISGGKIIDTSSNGVLFIDSDYSTFAKNVVFNFGGNNGFQIENLIAGNSGGFAGATFALVPEIASVPEPSTWAMLLLGFASVAVMTYRRSHKRRSFEVT